MAIYAVGDIQGCAVALEELLDDLRFDPVADRLWLTGDLVNRGPGSLETMRLVKQLGDSAITVLGNHDLHLLAVAAGVKELKPGDTLKPILRAPDCDELMEWMRHLPMAHIDRELKTVMVHAGLYPGWTVNKLERRAVELEQVLRSDNYTKFLSRMYNRNPLKWSADLTGTKRLRFITNAMTRMRYVDKAGNLNFDHKGPPGSQPKRLIPWYLHPALKSEKWRVVCGHWSAIGYMRSGRIIALDSGCVWGGALTAVRLDGNHQRQCWQVGCSTG